MKIERLAIVLTFLFAAGCSHGARLDTPSGFATLDSSSAYSYRATSANGVVLATRTQPNDVEANTEFWVGTLDAKLRDKGYVAEPARVVKTGRGLTGTQIRYTTTEGGRAHRYWLTVFTTKAKVFVVEAGGDKEAFEQSEATVDRAIATLDAAP